MKTSKGSNTATIDVVIIGAGPYGLSIAAHLKGRGVQFRIFGSAMDTWLRHMPEGMRLKSEGFASSLSDPDSTFSLGEYCRQEGLSYADVGLPVPLETFISYGLAFQRKFVPELEEKFVVSLRRSRESFEVVLADGEVVQARQVVVAVGLSYFEYMPPILATLGKDFVSHSSNHCTVAQFKGKEVTVVGAGASALDLAALLHQAGATVNVVARKPVVRFHDPPSPGPRPFLQRVRTPMTGIGASWRLVFCTRTPHLFRRLPERLRLKVVRETLGPAPGWFIKEQVVGKVPFKLGVTITKARIESGRISLELTDGTGRREMLVSDHVIAATGFKVDLSRVKFLSSETRAEIRSVEQTPILSSNFESSVGGLYFVGTAAANSFGPLLRFAYGARFTAEKVSRRLASRAAIRLAPGRATRNVEVYERG